MKNTPTYIAYHVGDTNAGETGEKRGIWIRIGAAWVNKEDPASKWPNLSGQLPSLP